MLSLKYCFNITASNGVMGAFSSMLDSNITFRRKQSSYILQLCGVKMGMRTPSFYFKIEVVI